LRFAGGDLHAATGRHEKDALKVQIARIVADVSRVGEIDVAPWVDGQVVGAVEPFAFELVGERLDRAILRAVDPGRDRNAAIAPRVGPFASDQLTLLAALEAVRAAARIAELGRLARFRIEAIDRRADIGKQNRSVWRQCRPLGKLAIAPELFELAARGHDLVLGRSLKVGGTGN